MSNRCAHRGVLGRQSREGGFTLIELMVVVLIIGILIAIALPTFLGARDRVKNRAVQSDLRHGLTAAKAYFAVRRTYVGFTRVVAEDVEPTLVWAARGNPPIGRVAIGGPNPTATQIQLVARSSSRYFCIRDITTGANAGTRYGKGALYTNVDAANECNAVKW